MKRGTTQIERNTMKRKLLITISSEDNQRNIAALKAAAEERSRERARLAIQSTAGNMITVAFVPIPAADRTKVPGKTSRLCPHCLEKSGRKVVRSRSYGRSAPLMESQLQPVTDLPRREPRISSRKAWWNRWIIRSLIAPRPDSPWFECDEIATCPECGIGERVKESDYARQFGPARLFLFRVKDWLGNHPFLGWFISDR
jgi:hypothetical protein